MAGEDYALILLLSIPIWLLLAYFSWRFLKNSTIPLFMLSGTLSIYLLVANLEKLIATPPIFQNGEILMDNDDHSILLAVFGLWGMIFTITYLARQFLNKDTKTSKKLP